MRKRESYRRAFDNFDFEKIAAYDEDKIMKLLADPGIIRNRLKINSAVTNAKAFLEVRKQFGSFERYIWSFTGGKTVKNFRGAAERLPATSPESDAMAKDLKKRGFKFCGSTICYAYMQSMGIVNDHAADCFRWKEL